MVIPSRTFRPARMFIKLANPLAEQSIKSCIWSTAFGNKKTITGGKKNELYGIFLTESLSSMYYLYKRKSLSKETTKSSVLIIIVYSIESIVDLCERFRKMYICFYETLKIRIYNKYWLLSFLGHIFFVASIFPRNIITM